MQNLTLLKCTTSICIPKRSNNAYSIFKERYKCKVGISDHTLGIGASIAAVSQGATIIEKHLTLNEMMELLTTSSLLSLKNLVN